MLGQFITWWLRQMRSLIPRRFAPPAGMADAMVVAIDDWRDPSGHASGQYLIRREGRETFAGVLDFSRSLAAPATTLPTCLRLPPGQVLQRPVSLPLAAERDLATMLGFEMDRLTPFGPDEIFWGVANLRRDRAQGRLNFVLLIAMREPVERLVAALGRLNLKPKFLECEGGRIPLAEPARASLGRSLQSGLYGILALACLAAPLIRQQRALDLADQQITALQPAAAEAMRLRQKLSVAASGQAAIAAAAQTGDPVQTLAALTQALPDGTWLSDLSLKSGQLSIDGRAGNAARMLAGLAGLPAFHDPEFSAPVTRSIDGASDLFSIHLTVGP